MRIVLLGDLHFYSLGVWPWELLGKRLWGQMNLWLRRRHAFRLERFTAVESRIHSIHPDLLLLAGDLTTTALPREFARARAALGPLLLAYPSVITPGNHDRHSFVSARAKYLEREFPEQVPSRFPQHRDLGNRTHLIVLDPTRPNFISDKGLIGPRQLDELRNTLAALPHDARVIVLCHYTLGMPPNTRHEHKRHRLIDEAELRTALSEGGRPTLYLHGHVHYPCCWRLPGAPNVVAVNAGAPLMHDAHWRHGQGFWEIQIAEDWELVHHAQDADGRWVGEKVELPGAEGEARLFER